MFWYLDFKNTILLRRKGMAVGLTTQRTTQSWKNPRTCIRGERTQLLPAVLTWPYKAAK